MIRIRAIRDLLKPFQKDDVICEMDEDAIDCSDLEDDGLDYEDQYYTGVPAPPYLVPDPWFGNEAPPYTEKQIDYMEKETELKKEEAARREESGQESEDIHKQMYDIATESGSTTTQLDPPGGSETFHEGPGGWMSGTGYKGQFK